MDTVEPLMRRHRNGYRQRVGIVMKRLEDAIADADYIHAVIKGSAINNDGSLKLAIARPVCDGQRR